MNLSINLLENKEITIVKIYLNQMKLFYYYIQLITSVFRELWRSFMNCFPQAHS